MATSGTTSFNLNIDDIITEGYERCGLVSNSGYDMRSARRSLDLLFAEWGNRGIHLWKTELNEIALVSGQANYTVDSDVNDVLEAYVSSTAAAGNNINTQDVSLTKIDRSAYAALPNKLATGQPSVHYSEFEPKHPQIRRKRIVADAIALQNSRAQKFQQPTNIDGVYADSGGTMVGVADLTLTW
jgi:hypothetical protein